MKYLLVGDLHGRVEVAQKVLSDKYLEYHKVFIGDYVDSFDRSKKDQITIVKLLLKAVQEREDVTALIGNHELSYLREGMQCSGYASGTKYHMVHLKKDILRYFKRHLYLEEGLLATHAGASAHLFTDKEDVRNALENDDPRLYYIGSVRGGAQTHGGIFWCDYWREFSRVEGLTQIVGHSSHRPEGKDRGIVVEQDCFNIDCLDRVEQVLIVDTTEETETTFEIIDL